MSTVATVVLIWTVLLAGAAAVSRWVWYLTPEIEGRQRGTWFLVVSLILITLLYVVLGYMEGDGKREGTHQPDAPDGDAAGDP